MLQADRGLNDGHGGQRIFCTVIAGIGENCSQPTCEAMVYRADVITVSAMEAKELL